jgi:hypothetical protein
MIRRRGPTDPVIPDELIFPYAVLPIAALDHTVSTTTDMNEANKQATSQWGSSAWRSDLSLLRRIALGTGPRR